MPPSVSASASGSAFKESYLFKLKETKKGIPRYLIATFEAAHEAMELTDAMLLEMGHILPVWAATQLQSEVHTNETESERLGELAKKSLESYWPSELYFAWNGGREKVVNLSHRTMDTLEDTRKASRTQLLKLAASGGSSDAASPMSMTSSTSITSPSSSTRSPTESTNPFPRAYMIMAVPIEHANSIPGAIPIQAPVFLPNHGGSGPPVISIDGLTSSSVPAAYGETPASNGNRQSPTHLPMTAKLLARMNPSDMEFEYIDAVPDGVDGLSIQAGGQNVSDWIARVEEVSRADGKELPSPSTTPVKATFDQKDIEAVKITSAVRWIQSYDAAQVIAHNPW